MADVVSNKDVTVKTDMQQLLDYFEAKEHRLIAALGEDLNPYEQEVLIGYWTKVGEMVAATMSESDTLFDILCHAGVKR
jgi:hypothetical protein